ncbi:MAG: hypothetical protein AB1921_05745 [Thermodesulfobacteriota bacterium]
MKQVGIVILAMVLVQVFSSPGWPARDKQAPAAQRSPHHTNDGCNLCHEAPAEAGERAPLKYQGRYEELCKCHTKNPDDYNHPIELPAPEEGKTFLERHSYIQNDEITCNACHDMKALHHPMADRAEEGPSPGVVKTQACFLCHDKENAEIFSPHAKAQGGADNCLACHATRPRADKDGFADVDFVEDMDELCLRCHRIKENHPSGANHLRQPTAKGLFRITQLAKKYHLPVVLNKKGQVTCATCHNPHAPDALPATRPGAKGAGTPFRERVPEMICLECHQV